MEFKIKKENIYVIATPGITFLLGVIISVYALTSGPGGSAKIKVGDNQFEITINSVDFYKLFQDEKYQPRAIAAAQELLNLYSIDHKLLTHIENLDYADKFSAGLRNLRDHFQGPFNTPDRKVKLIFSKELKRSEAKVCPNGDFYQKMISLVKKDFSNMIRIENARYALIHQCPPPQGEPERIAISREQGRELLGLDPNEELPASIEVLAKELPSFVIVNENISLLEVHHEY